MNQRSKAYIKLITAMLIWGSVGLFAKMIPMESAQIVLGRVLLGGIVLGIVYAVSGEKSSFAQLKKNIPVLALSGAAMGFNWIALFEAYKFTTVSLSTIAYYCAPIVVMAVSPFFLKERITKTKAIGILAAMAGLLCITGELDGGSDPKRGFLFGLLAAVLYASVTLLNKKASGISGMEITLMQLIAAGTVILPYAVISNQSGWAMPPLSGIAALLVIGIVHTGFALYLYFSSIQQLPGQTVALCSYIDPCSALVFSALFLGERMAVKDFAGAALILGGALYGELAQNRKGKTELETKDY